MESSRDPKAPASMLKSKINAPQLEKKINYRRKIALLFSLLRTVKIKILRQDSLALIGKN